jgi:carbon storage regulator CsrA
MLVFGREIEEEVIITVPPAKGQRRIRVKLVDIFGSKVRLGFDAGDDVEINRGEVQKLIDKEAACAANQ